MAGNRIKGITVEIGGDTTKLQTALKGGGQYRDPEYAEPAERCGEASEAGSGEYAVVSAAAGG